MVQRRPVAGVDEVAREVVVGLVIEAAVERLGAVERFHEHVQADEAADGEVEGCERELLAVGRSGPRTSLPRDAEDQDTRCKHREKHVRPSAWNGGKSQDYGDQAKARDAYEGRRSQRKRARKSDSAKEEVARKVQRKYDDGGAKEETCPHGSSPSEPASRQGRGCARKAARCRCRGAVERCCVSRRFGRRRDRRRRSRWLP